MTRIDGSRVLVTGASSGIGAQLCRELAGRGASVGLLARRTERLEAVAGEIRAGGGTAAWAEADVTDGAALHASLDRLAGELGGADVVVANAGSSWPENPKRWEPGLSEPLYDLNLLGMVRTLDWAIPRLRDAGGGHLVGVSSVASFFGFPGMTSYCGSKAAMRIHLQSLRVTWRRRGIRVTTICPGFVDSELTDDYRGKMPFKQPTDRAARRIADAIEKDEREVVFPWQLRWFVRMLRCLPPTVVEKVVLRG